MPDAYKAFISPLSYASTDKNHKVSNLTVREAIYDCRQQGMG